MSSGKKKRCSDLVSGEKHSLAKKLYKNANKKKARKDTHSEFVGLLNRKWKVFRVSPFYNFSINKLKFYEEKLDEEINSKNAASNISYKSNFTTNKNLKLNDQCVEALQLKVVKDESHTIYLSHFISWNSTNSKTGSSTSLPVLLVEARTNEWRVVHSSLCKIFDCDIQSVSFSLYALISFFVKLLETPRSNIDVSQEQVTMDYGVPDCEKNDNIKISLFLDSTTIAFAVIMDDLQEKFMEITTMEIIWEFYNKILNHMYHIFNLDLTLAELQKVSFPDAFLTSDGQLKMLTDNAAKSILNVLERFTPLDAITNM